MPRYAQFINDIYTGLMNNFPEKPPDITHKNSKWRVCTPVGAPSYDQLTEVLVGPTYTVSGNEYLESWLVRAKTPAEVSADKDASVARINSPYDPLIKILRNHENRLRILENSVLATNKLPLSLQEVRDAIKAIL